MKKSLKFSLFALVSSAALSISFVYAANPLIPFTPADRVLDPNCLPTDSNCYVSNTAVSNLNITGKAPTIVGSELITNGNFATGTSGWVLQDCASYGAGVVTVINTACSNTYVSTAISVEAGKTYLLTFTISGATGKELYVYNSGSVTFFNSFENNGTENGPHSIAFKSGATEVTTLYFEQGYSILGDGGSFSLDNVSAKEIETLTPSLTLKDWEGSSLFSIGSNIYKNIALGKNALGSNTSGTDNLAIGENALLSNLDGYLNTALGEDSLSHNVSGYQNTANGALSLKDNVGGNNNAAYGVASLRDNVNGSNNIGIGLSLRFNKNGSDNVSIGNSSGQNIGTSSGNIFVGHASGQGNSGYGSRFTSSANTMIGTESGFNIATSTGNLFLGYRSAYSQTLGDYNILLGYNNNLASTTDSNQLNIGNLIYGTALGINGTASTGNIGIGNSAPVYKLHVGNGSTAGVIARFQNSTGYCDINPTTTSLTCTSDERLKKNIVSLSSSTVLERLTNLNPVMYNWITEDNASSSHAGFIAQQVKPLFPDLVSEDENGTLSVAYGGFVPYVVEGLREVVASLTELKVSLTKLIKTDRVETKILCVGEEGSQTCISKSQLDSLLQQTNTFVSAPLIVPVVPTTTEESNSSSTEPFNIEASDPVVEDLINAENNISTLTNEN